MKNMKTVYNIISEVTNKPKNTRHSLKEILHENETVTDAHDIVEIMNNHFVEMHK